MPRHTLQVQLLRSGWREPRPPFQIFLDQRFLSPSAAASGKCYTTKGREKQRGVGRGRSTRHAPFLLLTPAPKMSNTELFLFPSVCSQLPSAPFLFLLSFGWLRAGRTRHGCEVCVMCVYVCGGGEVEGDCRPWQKHLSPPPTSILHFLFKVF